MYISVAAPPRRGAGVSPRPHTEAGPTPAHLAHDAPHIGGVLLVFTGVAAGAVHAVGGARA